MLSLKYAIRSLRRSPGFACIAIVTLGLGLGLFTTMFAVADAVLNPQTAIRDAQTLFGVNWRNSPPGLMEPVDLYRFIRDEARSFEAVVPMGEDVARVLSGDFTEDMIAPRVGGRWFSVTGVRPRLGRGFTDSDEDNVAVLGDRVWRNVFGRRGTLENATIQVNGRPYVVIGVLPRGAGAEILLPLPASVDRGTSSEPSLSVLVRLKHGVSREDADRELGAMAALLTDRFQTRGAPFHFELTSVRARPQELQDLHKALLGAALAVLLIGCDNLAHLMLARGLARRREVALRLALGASGSAVMRQMLLEVALVTVAGLVVGAMITIWGADVLRHRVPREVGWIGLVQPQLSWRVFTVASLAAAGSALLFGLVPVVRVVGSVGLDEPLKAESGTITGAVRHRFNFLVAAEVALALVLLVGCGLLLRTLQNLQREDPGVGSRTLFRMRTQVAQVPGPRRVPQTGGASREEILAYISGMPEVRDAAFAEIFWPRQSALLPERSDSAQRFLTVWQFPFVTPNYLRVLGLPIIAGRDFEPGDVLGEAVAIVDPIAAGRLYPGQDPVGRMVKLGGTSSDAPWVRIVGLVRSPNVLEASSRAAPPPSVFVVQTARNPFAQTLVGEVLIRTRTPDARDLVSLHRRLRALPGVSAGPLRPWDEARARDLVSRAFLTRVFVSMGAVALLLAVVGLHATLAYAVSRRMREFALRVALGATPRQLVNTVLQDAMLMLLAGLGVGAFVALLSTQYLEALLVAVLPWDVWALALSEVTLLIGGLLAAVVPAIRAARANPIAMMRAV